MKSLSLNMISKKDKIFVTGATGFVGSYIVRALLAHEYENITCLARNIVVHPFLSDIHHRVSWIQGDILDLPLMMDILKNIDVVIHAAAVVTFNTKNKNHILDTAISGTANLVNVCLDTSLKKFIHISSIAAIGRKKPHENITEKSVFSHSEYDTTYGLSKFLAEQEVWRGHAEGLPITILNPSFILGAGIWDKSSLKLFKRIDQNPNFYPLGTNGIVDVRDVAQATILAMNPNINGERFIISSENWTYKDIIGKIADKLERKKPHYGLTPLLGSIVWRFYWIKSLFTNETPIVTRETIKSMSVHSIYDNSKSISQLGLTYRDMEESITECADLYLESKANEVSWARF